MTVATDPRKTGLSAGMTLLAASAVAVSVTGTTNETTLATVTVPAGAMGLNGGVLIVTAWNATVNANAKTPRIRLGGTGGTVYFSPAAASTASFGANTSIRNRGAANSQVGGAAATSASGSGVSGLALPTSSVDTTASVDLVISGQLGTGTDTLTLERYEVWLLPG